MILKSEDTGVIFYGVPRVGGGDPGTNANDITVSACSPRRRG